MPDPAIYVSRYDLEAVVRWVQQHEKEASPVWFAASRLKRALLAEDAGDDRAE